MVDIDGEWRWLLDNPEPLTRGDCPGDLADLSSDHMVLYLQRLTRQGLAPATLSTTSATSTRFFAGPMTAA